MFGGFLALWGRHPGGDIAQGSRYKYQQQFARRERERQCWEERSPSYHDKRAVALLKVHNGRDPLLIIPTDNLGRRIMRMRENPGCISVGGMILFHLSIMSIMGVAAIMRMSALEI